MNRFTHFQARHPESEIHPAPRHMCAFLFEFRILDYFGAAACIIVINRIVINRDSSDTNRVRKAGFSMAGDIFPKAKNQSMIALTPADWFLPACTPHLIPADIPADLPPSGLLLRGIKPHESSRCAEMSSQQSRHCLDVKANAAADIALLQAFNPIQNGLIVTFSLEK